MGFKTMLDISTVQLTVELLEQHLRAARFFSYVTSYVPQIVNRRVLSHMVAASYVSDEYGLRIR